MSDWRNHVADNLWIRDYLAQMDDLCESVMGLRDFDDAVCVAFDGKLVASTDGPYDKRLVMKSALIHSATDVVVKGAKPVFALDNLCGTMEDVREMLSSLRHQALEMQIPILGGNTKVESTKPTASITVFGCMVTEEPIRDCCAKRGDLVGLLGEPIWGDRNERIKKAITLFSTWYELLESVTISSSKDVTKGGLHAAAYEMQHKSNTKFEIGDLSLPLRKNLDNFIFTFSEADLKEVKRVCSLNKCEFQQIGVVC